MEQEINKIEQRGLTRVVREIIQYYDKCRDAMFNCKKERFIVEIYVFDEVGKQWHWVLAYYCNKNYEYVPAIFNNLKEAQSLASREFGILERIFVD